MTGTQTISARSDKNDTYLMPPLARMIGLKSDSLKASKKGEISETPVVHSVGGLGIMGCGRHAIWSMISMG